MKRKLLWSLTGLLAGAGLAAAQDATPTSASADLYLMPAQAAQPVLSEPVNLGACTNGWGVDYRFYGRLEYILWQMNSHFSQSGNELLPAIRTNMPFGFRTVSYDLTNPLVPAVLRDPTTGAIITRDIFGIAQLDPRLFSGSGTDGVDHNGGRLTLGMFLDNRGEWSAEVSYFQTERKGAAFVATAASTINVTTGLNDVTIVTTVQGNPPVTVNTVTQIPVNFRGDFAASIEGSGTNRLYGLEFNVNHRDFQVGRSIFSEIYGIRYINLEQNQTLLQILSINDDRYVVRVDDPFAAGNPTPVTATTALAGSYSSRNQFFGLQVGGRIDSDWDRFYMNLVGKFGFGAMQQELTTKEVVSTFNVDAGGGITTGADIPFEVYPNPTDVHENKTRLAFILEGNLNLGYHITDCCSVYAGYDILVMTRIARPSGTGLPTNGSGSISILQNASAQGPALTHFNETRFYAQGLNAGLEFRF
jgi:hypothetical protein